jgi:diguanylate cyclase (GGDEF)-like protein
VSGFEVGVRRPQRLVTRCYEYGVAIPMLVWLAVTAIREPRQLTGPFLLVWAVSIGIVDLMPVPASIDLRFSLSFPLQLAVALVYPVPVAAFVAFLGTSDIREIRRQIPVNKALFNRAQIAASVAAESLLFHADATLHSPWFQLVPAVFSATIVGYVLNVVVVAWDFHLETEEPVFRILKQMHVGIFGEFVLSYMGLALFGVLVATSFTKVGIWSIAVFVAPLAFARQMFLRTHSLQKATSELETKQQEQQWQAFHDSLTGLPNRALFAKRLQEAVEEAADRNAGVAVMIMDLNDFKEINDALGHHYGDRLLEEIGPRLQGALRDRDLIARLGGDEFGVVIPELTDEPMAAHIAERLLAVLEEPMNLDGLAVDVSASIGIAIYPAHSQDVETLLRRADVAMYAAKESRGGYEIYSPARDRHSATRLTLLSEIRRGLEREEFTLFYQPKMDLVTGSVSGLEALIRWHHPERGMVLPVDFIELVERTVLVRPLTLYVLNEALWQRHALAREGYDLPLAVNLSARNLLDTDLPEQVATLLDRWATPPELLILELTESSLMTDSARSVSVLSRLSSLGVKVSIDDFGTGYSSLSHLRRLPINEIKVDRSFVTNMLRDPNDAMIVRATVDLGRNLGLEVVAEGVEDEATWLALRRMGCNMVQGFYVSRPLPGREVLPWLAYQSGEDLLARDRIAAPLLRVAI